MNTPRLFKLVDMETYLRYEAWLQQNGMQLMSIQSRATGNNIEAATAIIDLKGLGMRHFGKDTYSLLKVCGVTQEWGSLKGALEAPHCVTKIITRRLTVTYLANHVCDLHLSGHLDDVLGPLPRDLSPHVHNQLPILLPNCMEYHSKMARRQDEG